MIHRLLILVLLVAVCAAGCNTVDVGLPMLGGKATDEEQIAALLNDVHKGMESRRIYKVLAHVSSNYYDGAGRDHEAIREYLSEIMRKYREIRITRTRPRIVVHGARARAFEAFGTIAEPFDMTDDPPLNLQGQVSVYLEKENGVWKIVEWGELH